MGKRFSRYKFARRVSGGSAGSGTPLGRYIEYVSGTRRPTYPRAESSNPDGYNIIYLCPFGTGVDDRYQVEISKRAATQLPNLIEQVSLFHHLTLGANEVADINTKFQPAKAIVRRSGTGTTEETSQITGERYKKETGTASYTVPFGGAAAAGNDRLYTFVAKTIDRSSRAKSGENTVSFLPERWLSF
jgi:hypothetical protein